jgi:predicted Zn finger-like uncharacterized protein
MKIVCDACNTKYSIGDDRVAGKTFKVRCKKCSHVIVIRDVPVAQDDAEASPPLEDAWHVVIDGASIGPLERAELMRRRAAGDITSDALVWREGLPDWKLLGEIDELGVETPVAPVAPLDRARLRGERNESSVLFTLGTLAKLAAPPPAAAAAPATEGSGLIDIRTLASTFAAPSARSQTGSADDLPVFGAPALAEPIVLAPARRTADRRLVYALAGATGMLAIVAAVLAVLLVRDDAEARATMPPAPPAAPPPAPPAIATLAPVAPPPVQSPVHIAEAAPVTPAPAVTPEPARPRKEPAPQRPRRPEAPAPVRATAPTNDGCTEVSCIVNGYTDKCCEVYREKKQPVRAPPPARELPESLDKDAMTAGIAQIKAKSCGAASPATGVVKVSIKVSPAGSVASVTVRESPDDALASCVVAASKKATFPATQRGGTFTSVWRF